jgi:hypothetical protein
MTGRNESVLTPTAQSEPLREDAESAHQTSTGRNVRVQRQAFLVGPTVYLRPVELADARLSAFWRPIPFPTPVGISEEQLKESIPAEIEAHTRRLIACRRSDNLPS